MAETHTASLVGGERPAVRPRAALLRVLYPRDLDWSFRCAAEPLTLGRQPDDGSPPLHHATVSRRHAQVWWDVQGHHAVRDAGSRHGTRLGGTAIGEEPRVLSDGDVLRLGDVFVIYELPPEEDGAEVDRETLPGTSPAIARLRAKVAAAAPDPSPALITGETGTGKEWVARELHRLSRRTGPLVAASCATLTRELVDRFRQAAGGTLFLDDIGELAAELQSELVRVVGASETITADVRLIAATNRDPAAAVEAGAFRRDLLARLRTWELAVPRLTERRGDLMMWIDRLWSGWHTSRGQAVPELRFTPMAAAALFAAPWPDNLRGVDRLVHELAGVRSGAAVDVADLPAWLRPPSPARPAAAALGLTMLSPPPRPTVPGTPAAMAATLGEPAPARPPVPTREEFLEVWERLDHSVRAVARHFGRDRRQIYRWLDTHGIRAPATEE